ncbi:MAG: ATP-dependent DNA helicase [Varibaculum sp.]|nr:ATP-dependent DNA helicase [Varibaculum sp.]
MSDSTTVCTPAELAAVINESKPKEKRVVPNPEQTAVISSTEPALLVVAGAGAGKTTTISQRIMYYMVNQNVAPERVLALTFTNKAAGQISNTICEDLKLLLKSKSKKGREIQETLKLRNVDEESQVNVSTYSAFGEQIVREFGFLMGLNADVQLITEPAAYLLMRDIVQGFTAQEIAQYGYGYTEKTGELKESSALAKLSLATVISGALELNENIANYDVDMEQLDRENKRLLEQQIPKLFAGSQLAEAVKIGATARLRDFYSECVRRYRNEKSKRGLIDYSDQNRLALRVVADPGIRKSISDRYDMVVLDEFQDTSSAQLKLIKALFAGKSVTAVGDPNQSIYAWRGASQQALIKFKAEFIGSDLRDEERAVLNLSTSWRNSKRILRVANLVSAPLRGEWKGKLPELQPRKDADEGVVYRYCTSGRDTEAEKLVEYFSVPAHREGTLAVLCRRRSDLQYLKAYFDRAGIPSIMVGLSGLLSTPVVSDIWAVLQVLNDAGDSRSVLQLLIRQGLGARDISQLWLAAKNRARTNLAERLGVELAEVENNHADAYLMDVLDSPAELREVLSDPGYQVVSCFAKRIRTVRPYASGELVSLVGRILRVFQLETDAFTRSVFFGNDLEVHNIRAFVEAVREYLSGVAHPSLPGLLGWLDAADQEGRGLAIPEQAEEMPGVVQLMTVHAAKGLEWDTVVVAGMAEGVFPGKYLDGADYLTKASRLLPKLRDDYTEQFDFDGDLKVTKLSERITFFREKLSDKHLLEELRLAYVALTRAKKILIVGGYYRDSASASHGKMISSFIASTAEYLEAAGVADAKNWEANPQADSDAAPVGVFTELMEDLPTADTSLYLPNTGADDSDDEPTDEPWPQKVSAYQRKLNKLADEVRSGDVDELTSDNPYRELVQGYIEAHKQGVQPVRLPQSLAVTRYVGYDTNSEGMRKLWLDLRRPIPRQPGGGGGDFGTRLHSLIEQRMRGHDVEPDGPDATQLKAMLQNIDVLHVLESFEPVSLETEFSARVPFKLASIDSHYRDADTLIKVSAKIDAVMRERTTGKIWLLDWKSDSNHQAHLDRYQRQLRLYARIFQEVTRITPAGAYLVFLSEGKPDPRNGLRPGPEMVKVQL